MLGTMYAQAYIDALAKCLMEGADDPSTPAHARMCELIKAMVSAVRFAPQSGWRSKESLDLECPHSVQQWLLQNGQLMLH
jgi:hypothetical protein